jgi:hypothetical protein
MNYYYIPAFAGMTVMLRENDNKRLATNIDFCMRKLAAVRLFSIQQK